MPWLDLDEGIADLFGQFAEEQDDLAERTLFERAAYHRGQARERQAVRRANLQRRGLRELRPSRRKPPSTCELCGRVLADRRAYAKRCAVQCAVKGPFVVVLYLDVEQRFESADIETAARVARVSATYHRAEARLLSARGALLGRFDATIPPPRPKRVQKGAEP